MEDVKCKMEESLALLTTHWKCFSMILLNNI